MMFYIDFHPFTWSLEDCRCREQPGLVKIHSWKLVAIDSQVTQVFNLNILLFEFPNILSLNYVANVTNLSVFSLINDVCRIAL